MAGTKFNPELAAAVLLEAVYRSDEYACTKYGVSIQSVRGWRRRLKTDPTFSTYFQTKKAQFDKAWAEQIPVALRKAMRALEEAFDAVDKSNPRVIARIAGAIKILADVQMTGRWIDARIGTTDRTQDQIPGPRGPEPEHSHVN